MKRLQIISGPCSAESEIQVLKTAEGLKDAGVDYFRAGLWKPRTHPGCFEGAGVSAIPWMKRVRDEFGLKICTEVANRQHTLACIDAGFDMLWIGARTTVNTFQVQEIAEALKGADIPVYVKNPVSRDLGLWAGAIERLRAQGISNPGLIHRGFPTFEQTRYRNLPEWQAAIEMRSAFPDLPMICDPSHIAGDAALVAEIAQQAVDLGLDGLMIECHFNPESALSDRAQQLTPEEFTGLISSLHVRDRDTDDRTYRARLAELRSKIDTYDDAILYALARRMDVSREIGRIKREHNISILQMSRWDELMEKAVLSGKEKGLPEEFVRAVFNEIHKASVISQKNQ